MSGATVHQALEPSLSCYRLRHRIDDRPRSAGTGKLSYCVVCTLGYEMALSRFNGDEEIAETFVKALRRETKPVV